MTGTDNPGFEFRTYRKWNVDRAEFIDLYPGDAVPENVRIRAYYTPDEGDDLGLLAPRLETDAEPWSAQWWAEYVEMLEAEGYKEVD